MTTASTAPLSNPDVRVAELEREALAARGTDNQRARYAELLLPEDELLAIARAELFAPFNDFQPFRALKPKECGHADRRCRGWVEFATCEAGELTHDEYESVAHIRRAAEIAADHHWIARSAVIAGAKLGVDPSNLRRIVVAPTTHWGTCKECKHETTRSSARVSILWAGRSLTREYRL